MPALDRKTSSPPRASRFLATEFGAAPATAAGNLRVPVETPDSESQLGRSSPCDLVGATFESGRHCDARPPRAHAQVDSHTHVVTVHIRSLTAEDVDPLTAALAEAFHRDDLAVWIFPDQRVRDAALAAMFRSRLSEASTTTRRSWTSRTTFPERRSGNHRASGSMTIRHRVRVPMSSMHFAPSSRPVPSHRTGTCTGSARVPNALMTGAERNLAFYRKHGYRELRRFDFRGASAWWMWRDPV